MTSIRLASIAGTFLFGLLTACGGLVDDTAIDGADPSGTATNANPADASTAATEASGACPTPATPVAAGCPCSRRACSPPSMDCPRGAGTSTSTRLGPAGGTASLDGTPSTVGVPFSLDVFPGSLATDVNVELRELSVPTPDGFVDWSPVYAVEPGALELTNGGALRIPWRVPHSGGGTVPKTLTVYASASLSGPWQSLPDSYTNAGFSQATALGGGYFFVGYPKPDDACQ